MLVQVLRDPRTRRQMDLYRHQIDLCRPHQGFPMLRLTAWTLGVVFPSTPQLPGLDAIDCQPLLRNLSAQAPFTIRATMHLSVLLFCLTPILTLGIPLPAFLLSKAQVDRHAQKLSMSSIYLLRQIMLMIKTIGGLIWGAAPEVRQKFGMVPYPGDTSGWRQA